MRIFAAFFSCRVASVLRDIGYTTSSTDSQHFRFQEDVVVWIKHGRLAVCPDRPASIVGIQLQPRAGVAGSQQYRSQLQRSWLGHFHPRHRRILARARAVHLSRQKSKLARIKMDNSCHWEVSRWARLTTFMTDGIVDSDGRAQQTPSIPPWRPTTRLGQLRSA